MDTHFDDIRDVYGEGDFLFTALVVSDAIRRGIHHYDVHGNHLPTVGDVLTALQRDGDLGSITDDSVQELGN